MQPVADAIASLRDSLADLNNRSIEDPGQADAVSRLAFRANEHARRVADALTGSNPPDDKTAPTAQLLAASAIVRAARSSDPLSIVRAITAARDALNALEAWLDSPRGMIAAAAFADPRDDVRRAIAAMRDALDALEASLGAVQD